MANEIDQTVKTTLSRWIPNRRGKDQGNLCFVCLQNGIHTKIPISKIVCPKCDGQINKEVVQYGDRQKLKMVKDIQENGIRCGGCGTEFFDYSEWSDHENRCSFVEHFNPPQRR